MKERRKMKKIFDAKRIIIKVGTSTLTHENGHLDLRRIETLVRTVSDFKNQGREVVLVSSGAVSAGIARLNLDHRPRTTEEKQALAAVGQSQLMNIYERFFAGYGHSVGQILMTKDVIDNPHRFAAAEKNGVRPEDCTVFDDSAEACKGAKSAGMRTVGVFDRYFNVHTEEMMEVCDQYIRSFEELL